MVFGALLGFLAGIACAAPLEEFKACRLIPTDWADGDSFLVRFPDGKERTVRLYGGDCLEFHVNDPTDERRLRAQRRYFGITAAEADPGKAIALAKNFGEQAARETEAMLSKSFTVHTAFADARGDGRHQRIYGFVVTAKGADLAAHLISKGLARAFGVYRQAWNGMSQEEYRAHLSDLELQAAKKGAGVWARTDWDSLPTERAEQRNEEAEIEMALDNRKLEEGVKLNPNTAARDELMKLPGIGEAYANRIIEGRPYEKLEDLSRVSGIGPATLDKLAPFLTFSGRE